MEKVTLGLIQGILSELNIYCPRSNLGPKTLLSLADMWFEDFEDMDAAKLYKAVKMARKTSNGYIPEPSKIIENYNSLQSRIPESRQIEHKQDSMTIEEMKAIRMKNFRPITNTGGKATFAELFKKAEKAAKFFDAPEDEDIPF